MKLWPDRIPGVKRRAARKRWRELSDVLNATAYLSLDEHSRSERLPRTFTSGLHWLMRCRICCTAIAIHRLCRGYQTQRPGSKRFSHLQPLENNQMP
jgi:hypothetical protein